MRRKLINWEAFDRIQKDSLSAAEHELLEASEVLARALDVDHLDLNCFGESNVIYETVDGTYVRADYDLASNHLTFENIEELVVDEETANQASKKTISDMVEAILSNENEKASQFFSEYMSSPVVRKNLTEGRNPGFVAAKDERKKAAKTKEKTAGTARIKQRKRKLDAFSGGVKKTRVKRGTHAGPGKNKNYWKEDWKRRKNQGRKIINAQGKVERKRFMKECYNLSENVIEFVSYKEYGPILKESTIRRDEKGQVVAVRVPTAHLRNENRIATLTHKHMLDNDVKNIREEAHELSKDSMFCKAIAELKRHNNMSDSDALAECLNNIIGRFPSVLYLTQTELARTVGEALDVAGVSNYDDATCAFIAEGILRTAHEIFGDKVKKILRLAQAVPTNESDAYIYFQNIVHDFYPTLDESFALEIKVFKDLFDAVNEVWEQANGAGDTAIANDAENILEELSAVVHGEMNADLDLAQEVAEWLQQYAESNLEGGEWQVVTDPHTTISGDHPAMSEKARKSYSPAADSGSDATAWHNRATEKQFTGQQWTSVGGGDIYPGLDNPYIPKAGEYTMKGEKGMDKDWKSGEGSWESGDTYPGLHNPYVPRAETPKSYQMKNGSETDLVVR